MSIASGVLSAITAAGKLFSGYGTVTLGPVQFSGLGLPASMPIGGKQAVIVHKLPGGARILDVMGQDDDDISWRGILDGQDASTTARTLDKLRRSGTVLKLAWDVYSYQVIVSEFKCDTRFVPPMNYSIACVVLADNTLVSGTTLVSMALQVTQDLASGNPLGALSAVSQGIVGNSVATAGAAAAATGATTVGSTVYNAAVGAVNTAASAIQTATSTANTALAPLGVSLSSISLAAPEALDVVGASTSITNAVSSCTDLASLSAAAGYVSRAQQNLLRATT